MSATAEKGRTKNNDRMTQLRLFIEKPLKVTEFKYTVEYTTFAFSIGSKFYPSKKMILDNQKFTHISKYDKDNQLACLSDEYNLFTAYDYKKLQNNQIGNRGGLVTYKVYQYNHKTKKYFLLVTINANWFLKSEGKLSEYTIALTKAPNGTPNNTKKTQNIGKGCPHTHDGAWEVAKYIVDEIKRNVKSETANKIRELLKEFERRFDHPTDMEQKAQEYEVIDPYLFSALQVWAAKVGDKKDWDHKPKIRDNLELKAVAVHRVSDLTGECLKSHHHKYKGFDYFYDVWSNIHYGYVGLSVGFDENTLLLGSNTQQFFHSLLKADTPDDITTMKMGFELYKKFGKNAEKLQPQDVLNILDKTPQAKFPASKKIHICYDSTAKKCKE